MLARSEMLGRRTHLIVELDWSGGLLLSVEDLEIATDDGDTKLVHGCLSTLTLSEQLDAPGEIGEFDGVTIAGVLPVDVPALVAAGQRLELSTGRVSRWVEGSTWERRELLYRGLVSDPEWGEADDETRCSLEPEDVVERRPCIPVDAVVSERTWDTAGLSEADLGKSYPTIIGYPGRLSDDGSDFVTASKGVWVYKRRYWHQLLLAGHPVGATTVRINSNDQPDTEEVAVTRTTDALGRIVSIVDFHATDDGVGAFQYDDTSGTALAVVLEDMPAVADSYDVFVCWPEGGGMLGPDGQVLRGAGDVLTWALGQCDAPVDLGRCKAAAALLNHIKIDGVIELGNGTMWQWLTAQLLPLLPCSIQDGPDGRYPVVWRYDATRAEAEFTLDLDLELDADVSSIRTDSSQVRNEFVLRYAPSKRTGNYQREVRLGHVVPEYATAVIEGFAGESILVEMAQLGLGGSGVVITVTGGAGPLAVTPSATNKTIVIDFVDGVSTAQAVANKLRTDAPNLVRRAIVRGNGSTVWNSGPTGQDQTRTTALRRSNGAQGSLICDWSQRRYARPSDPDGRRVVLDEMTTDYVCDGPSASAVLRWRAAAYALGVRRLTVSLLGQHWGHLRRGAVGIVKRAALSLDAVCLVEQRELSDDGIVSYTLRLLESPERDLVQA